MIPQNKSRMSVAECDSGPGDSVIISRIRPIVIGIARAVRPGVIAVREDEVAGRPRFLAYVAGVALKRSTQNPGLGLFRSYSRRPTVNPFDVAHAEIAENLITGTVLLGIGSIIG